MSVYNKLAAKAPRVVVIPHDMHQRARVYYARKEPTLRRLQRMVGGYIERVPHWHDFNGQPCNAWINEEGKLINLPVNMRATVMWYARLGRRVDDCLVGNVILTVNFPEDEYGE